MPLAKCGGCGRFISATEGAKCGNCQSQYHRACVGMPTKGNVAHNWQCPECKRKIPRDNKAETPVRAACGQIGVSTVADVDVGEPSDISTINSPSADDSQELLPSTSPIRDVVRGVLSDTHQPQQQVSTDLQNILQELKAVRAEIHGFRQQMQTELAELKESLGNCNTRLDTFEARVAALEQRAHSGAVQSPNVDSVVEELRRELNDRDQDLLANDIEISNLPEFPGENPVHIALVIGQKLGVTVEERDIVSAERVGGRHINATSPVGPVEQRPRPIVVRMARRDVRDQLLSGARVRRGTTTTSDLGIAGPPKRFYLNERLTKLNRQLFRKTRDAATLHGWRYVWTKRGSILVRNKAGEPTHRIRTESDISAIIDSANKTT